MSPQRIRDLSRQNLGLSRRSELLLSMLGFRPDAERAGDFPMAARGRWKAAWPFGKVQAMVFESHSDSAPLPWDAATQGPDALALPVAAALQRPEVDWVIATNGGHWRLYSGQVSARLTRYYEIDLEAILSSSEIDSALKYWWLFFRATAFEGETCWLDESLRCSELMARRSATRLSERIFRQIIPNIVQGFLEKAPSTRGKKASADDLQLAYEAALALVVRLVFLLMADARGLLPAIAAREAVADFQQMIREIAVWAGPRPAEAQRRLSQLSQQLSSANESLYRRLLPLCAVADDSAATPLAGTGGALDPPDRPPARLRRVAEFLSKYTLCDRYLAKAIDGLTREPDEESRSLEFLDYRVVEGRLIGDVYEQSLQYSPRLEQRDAPQHSTSVRLSRHRGKRRTQSAFYTPASVVRCLVGQAVGGAMDHKLETLGTNVSPRFPPTPIQGDSAVGPLQAPHVETVPPWLKIRVLDPAMGVGHLLLESVDTIAERALSFLHERRGDRQGDASIDVGSLRHQILRHCIYGVDLDPWAVQTAKLVLWLHASNKDCSPAMLDGNLRCGNSLIGSSFSSSHEVLRPGASKMAHHAWAASELGLEAAQRLLETGRHERGLQQRLLPWGDDGQQWLVELQRFAEREDLRFLHWGVEFPEVAASLADHEEAGFDVIVANPPYLRMEQFKPLKAYLRRQYRCHADRADLFIYFYERAVELLKTGGRLAFIAPSNWTKTSAGRCLRDFLRNHTTLDAFYDLSEARVFPDASTYPCILVARKNPPPRAHQIVSHRVLDPGDLEARLTGDSPRPTSLMSQSQLASESWWFEDRQTASLRKKLQAMGAPLIERVGSPCYGVKTGLNAAFIVDRATRDRLIACDPACSQVLKPVIEGKDIKPWRIESRDRWLIYLSRGSDIEQYPSLQEHLSAFQTQLRRRATKQAWCELQQAQVRYAEVFSRPKIVYPRFVNRPVFALDFEGRFINNALSVLPVEDSALLFYLMSPISWFFLRAAGAPMANGYRQIHGHVLESLPVPDFPAEFRAAVNSWIGQAGEGLSLEQAPWELLYRQLRLTKDEIDLLGLGSSRK